MTAIETSQGYLGDEKKGIRQLSLAENLIAFLEGSASKKQAQEMPRQTRREQLNMTSREMVGGQARYHLPSAPPAGLDKAWLIGATSSPDQCVMFLDTPGCRPDPDRIAYGNSAVMMPTPDRRSTDVVDQVKNVRFLLQHYGRTDWSTERIVAELIARRFSTSQLRAIHTTATFVTVSSAPNVIAGVLKNLEFYETGVLRRGVGGGFEPIEIAGCIPPDGPWAEPADFDRIRTFLCQTDKANWTFLTFAGTRASYNGEPVVFQTVPEERRGGTLCYNFALTAGYPKSAIAPGEHLYLEAELWNRSIVNAIGQLGDAPVRIADPNMDKEGSETERLSILRRDHVLVSVRDESLTQQIDALFERINDTDPDGRLRLQGALFTNSQTKYNTLHAERDEVRQEIAQIEAAIAREVSTAPPQGELSSLLRLVASLKDPVSQEFRDLWNRSLTRVRFTAKRSQPNTARAGELSWTGVINLHDHESGSTVSIPFEGCQIRERPGSPIRARTIKRDESSIDALRRGTPIASDNSRTALRTRKLASSTLGISLKHGLLRGCDDSRIIRTAVQLLEHRDKTITDLAVELNEDPEFIRRIKEVHVDSPQHRSWLRAGPRAAAAFYAIAEVAGGVVSAKEVSVLAVCGLGQVYNLGSSLVRSGSWASARKAGYRLNACSCGSTSFVILSCPEPDGVVCIDCRRDRRGLVWPCDPYDRYIAHQELRELAKAGAGPGAGTAPLRPPELEGGRLSRRSQG